MTSILYYWISKLYKRIILISCFILIEISGFSMLPPPTNDEPCNSISLTVNNSCTFSSYTTTGATASNVPDPGCAGYLGGDVWFQVTVPATGILNIETDNIDFSDGGMALYSGSCNALNLIACDDDNGSGHMPAISANGLTPASTVWIRVWENGNNENGLFNICVTTFQPPLNDNPCNATLLPVNNTCTYTNGDNTNATGSNIPDPNCANYQGGDVWYKVVVPANGYLDFSTISGSLTNCGMAIYQGSCTNLNYINCDDDDGPGNMPHLSALTLTPNDTIWIRIWDYGNDDIGDFGICVTSQSIITPPSCQSNAPAGNTCATATQICNLNGYCGNTSSSYTQDYWSELNNTFQSCVNGLINNDSYLMFTASTTSASFNVWVTTSTGGDGIQMMFFEATNCSGPVVCHGGYDNLIPSLQPHLVDATNLIPGNTYYLMIDGVHGDDCNYVIEAISGIDILTLSPNTSICAGENITLIASGINDPSAVYNWSWTDENGIPKSFTGTNLTDTPSVNTTYTVIVSGLSICPQTKTVTVTVNPKPIATITPPASTIITCSNNNISLNATGGNTYVWTSNGNQLGTGSYLNVTMPGTYWAHVTNNNGCTDSTSIVITQDTNSQNLSISSNPGTTLDCNISYINLSASVLNNISWSNGSTTLGNNSAITINQPGTYTATYSAPNGCISTASVTITQNSSLPNVVINSSGSVLDCNTNSINLSASGGVTYNWTLGSSSIGSNSNLTVNQPGTYIVSVTGTNGCTSTASINISQDINLPNVQINSTATELNCNTNAIGLSATGGSTYTWSNGSGTIGTNPNINISQPGTYSVSTTGTNGCSNTANINITQASNYPNANISNNGPICSGTDGSFIITGTAGSTVTYNVNGGSNSTVVLTNGTATLNYPALNNNTTINLVRVENGSCFQNLNQSSVLTVDNFSFNLSVNPNPANANQQIDAQITSSSTIATSTWSPGSLFVNNNNHQIFSAPNHDFTIEVTATSVNGCVATQSVNVNVNNNQNIYYIPNSFIPSMSGNTDINTFKIYGTNIKSANLKVYNQWGNEIFVSSQPQIKGWDGTYKGKLQPSGVYAYVVKIIFTDDTSEIKSGSINLIR